MESTDEVQVIKISSQKEGLEHLEILCGNLGQVQAIIGRIKGEMEELIKLMKQHIKPGE